MTVTDLLSPQELETLRYIAMCLAILAMLALAKISKDQKQ